MRLEPAFPYVVRVVEEAAPETNVGHILISAIGVIGVLLVGSLVLGLLVGALFVGFRKLRPEYALHGEANQSPKLDLSSQT